MGSDKESQAARNAADRRLREHFIQEYSQYMEEEHAKRGLTWNRRATPEQRAQREQEEREAKALARIAKIAKENGLTAAATNRVLIAVQGEADGETGVSVEDLPASARGWTTVDR